MLELRYISFAADDAQSHKEILKHINLTIDERFVAVTGPNGGGKSTLAKVIAGILTPHRRARFCSTARTLPGSRITERARRGISFAFQQPVRFKGLTVRDLMHAGGRHASWTVAEVCSYLSEVGLCAKDYIDREVNASLSGGELKRIEIAMIIARGTKLSIFDEPEAGIDLWSLRQSDPRLRENARKDQRLHTDHLPSGAYPEHRRPHHRHRRRRRWSSPAPARRFCPRLLGGETACRVLTDKL